LWFSIIRVFFWKGGGEFISLRWFTSLTAYPRFARACEARRDCAPGRLRPVGGDAAFAAESQLLMKPQPEEATPTTKRDCASAGQAAPRRPEQSEDTP